jgi:transcriptional regulator with XRE-family HTH domain
VTPFGAKLRELRQVRGVKLKDLAEGLGVSSAYLSALEHGKRGRPSWYLVQGVLAYFSLIWDEAEEIVRLARISHPRVTIDTSGLSPTATELANKLADHVARLDQEEIKAMLILLAKADKHRR